VSDRSAPTAELSLALLQCDDPGHVQVDPSAVVGGLIRAVGQRSGGFHQPREAIRWQAGQCGTFARQDGGPLFLLDCVAMLMMAGGIASVSLFGADAGFGALMPSFAVIGIGGGLTVPLTSSVLDAMPRAEAGVASGIFNASREVSGLLGITVFGAVLTARQAVLLTDGASPTDAFFGGYQTGLFSAAGLVALGGVAAFVGLRPAGRSAKPDLETSVPQPVSEPAPVTG